MRSRTLAWTALVVVAGATLVVAQQADVAGSSPQSLQGTATYGQLPLTFEANRGQTNPQVKFLSRGKGYMAALTATGMVLSLRANEVVDSEKKNNANASSGSQSSPNSLLTFRLVGGAQNPAVIGEDLQPGKVNYFIGNNPAKWHTNVPTYAKVRYKNIYPGIDLLYYGNHRQLEYDFAVLPGADPSQIQFEILGASQIQLDAQGNLVLNTGAAELHFNNPLVYQEFNGLRVPVSGGYVVNDPTHIAFHVTNYDPTKPLVIDPVLVYSTYLGGSGDDQPSGIAVDGTGSVYVAGFTDSTDFPLATLGSLPGGAVHVFVAKLDPAGHNLVYADYIGGNSQDYGYALVLDSADNVYVTGSTASSDFPLVNPFQATYPGSFNGFLSKVSADGSSLLYSTYYGGNGSDIPSSIAIDAASEVLVAGNTTSTNFPVANAYQSTASPNQGGVYGNYGFLTKFSQDGSSLVYSTYFAGNSNVAYNCGIPCWPSPFSAINGIALDSNGNAYAVGNTNTYNFPITSGAYLSINWTHLNAYVGFVSKFSSSGALAYSTYFYESSGLLTSVNAVAVDGSGSAYVTGAALSDGTLPITSTSICDPSLEGLACGYAFVTKFDPMGSSLQYSTFLGANNTATPRAIVLDPTDDAFVLASTMSSSFGMVNGIEPYANGSDLLLVEIDPLAGTQLFATYLGGSADEYPAGIAVDSSGSLYIAGSTDSIDFPVTPGAFQDLSGGNTDVFVLKIGPNSAPSVSANPDSLQYSSQPLGSLSAPQSVLVRNMGSSPLTISSIAASGDFTESSSCGTSVPAAGSCSLSVTFAPTASGTRTGSVLIQDDAAGSPHAINLSGIGVGSAAAVNPSTLTFSAQPMGTSSAAQAVTLTNTGNAALNVAAIQATGDFAQTDNCPTTLAATFSCTINVTFTPTAVGIRSGTLAINDNAPGNPQTVSLAGTGSVAAPLASVTPVSLVFPDQPVTTSSATRAVTLTNTGSAALNVGSVQLTGDYAQTNNCGTQLPSGDSCAINITFSPKLSGTRNGTLTLTDNAQGSPQTVSLSGTASDFSLATSPSENSVKAGTAATYTVTVSAVSGSFPNAVNLSCSGLPAHATCSFSPKAVTPGASSATSTLTITTSASSAQVNPALPSHHGPVYAVWIQVQAIGLFGIVLVSFRKRSKPLPVFILLVLMGFGMISMSGCAGGTGIAPQTTSGTSYTVTVTGTSSTLQHSLPVSLTVQ